MSSRRSSRAKVIQLNVEDSLVFAEAPINPPKPTAKLQDALRQHDELLRVTDVLSR